MQGKLSEIDIRSILQLIELGQRTGELFVEAHSNPINRLVGNHLSGIEPRPHRLAKRYWFVFFLNGQIVYAADAETSLSRLSDYLRRYSAEAQLQKLSVPAIAALSAPEYGYLWALLENHTLTPAQGRSIIQGMVNETLFDLLSLHQGSFIFEVGLPLSPQLTTLEIAPLITRIMKQIQEWKQFHPQIQSPDQCPLVSDRVALQAALSATTFDTLNRYANGKVSIRQIARYLGRDILTVARAIYPYVKGGMIQLSNSLMLPIATSLPQSEAEQPEAEQLLDGRAPHIVCIDDSGTVRQTVEHILDQAGYTATAIGNPLEALSLVFQLKPDLILCDIAMPELDGYEIAAMLRRSTAFRQTPIVMLTGKDGFIDRVKAKMVGATDYLTKPFGAGELLMIVERYVVASKLSGRVTEPLAGFSPPTTELRSPAVLVDSSKDELESDTTERTSQSSAPFH